MLLYYLGKQETRKLRVFTKMLHAFTQNPRNTLKISPGQSWTTIDCQNDRLCAGDRT